MSKLIDGKDELGLLFHNKTCKAREKLQEQDRELEFDRLCDEVGIDWTYYDGSKREFYEVGFHCACKAVGRQTNAVVAWGVDDDEFVVVYADDAEAAKSKILEFARELRRLARAKK